MIFYTTFCEWPVLWSFPVYLRLRNYSVSLNKKELKYSSTCNIGDISRGIKKQRSTDFLSVRYEIDRNKIIPIVEKRRLFEQLDGGRVNIGFGNRNRLGSIAYHGLTVSGPAICGLAGRRKNCSMTNVMNPFHGQLDACGGLDSGQWLVKLHQA